MILSKNDKRYSRAGINFANCRNTFAIGVTKSMLACGMLSMMLMTSCKESEPTIIVQPEAHEFNVSATSVELGALSNLEATINVKTGSTNTPWSLSNNASWLSVSPTEGNYETNVKLVAAENRDADNSRIATLAFNSQVPEFPFSQNVSVTQASPGVIINPRETNIVGEGGGHFQVVSVDSNVEWTASTDKGWLSLGRSPYNALEIVVSENYGSERQATINLCRKGTSTVTSIINYTQRASDVSTKTEALTFPVAGGEQTIRFHSDAHWFINGPLWITASPSEGMGGLNFVTLTAPENSTAYARSGSVSIRVGATLSTSNAKKTIAVEQPGVSYSVSPTSLSFGVEADTKTVTVDSNTDWAVVSAPNWVTVTPATSSASSTQVSVTTQANQDTKTRSGVITFGRSGFSGNKSVSVRQQGRSFSDLADNLHFGRQASSLDVSIVTDGAWQASTNESWIHLSPVSGVGSSTLNVAVDENEAKDNRTGHVQVVVGSISRTIEIVQDGRYTEISCDNVISSANASTITISIASNVPWTAQADVNWLTLDKTSGSANVDVVVSVAANPSKYNRQGNIVIKNQDVEQVLSFTQPGRRLTVSSTQLSFPSPGGTSETILITADGGFSISASDSWLTISQTSNTFTVTADALEGETERNGSITISLTGLPEGEDYSIVIPVKQTPQMVTIGRGEFGEDEDWNF